MTLSRRLSRPLHFLLPLLIILLIAVVRFSQSVDDPELKVLASGVGFGRIVSTDGSIDCGTPVPTTPPTPPTTNCRFGYGMDAPVTLQPSTGSAVDGSRPTGLCRHRCG